MGLKGPGGDSRGPTRRRASDNNDDDPPRGGRPGAAPAAEPRRAGSGGTKGGASKAASKEVVVILDEIDPKKGSVRFNTSDKDAAVTSIYINKSGIPNVDYNRVRLTIEFLSEDDDD